MPRFSPGVTCTLGHRTPPPSVLSISRIVSRMRGFATVERRSSNGASESTPGLFSRLSRFRSSSACSAAVRL